MTYSIAEAAKETGLSDRTLRRYIAEGRLHPTKVANQYVLAEEDINRFRKPRKKAPLSLEVSSARPLMIASEIKDLLTSINTTFTSFSESNAKIAGEYKQTVLPLMRTITHEQDPEEAFKPFLEMMQAMINSFVGYKALVEREPEKDTYDTFFDMLTENLPFPLSTLSEEQREEWKKNTALTLQAMDKASA